MNQHLLENPVTTLAAVLALHVCASAQVFYVDDNAAPGGNGTTWTLAYTSLDSALIAAGPGSEIWVAEGTYKPRIPTVAGDSRSVTFDLPALPYPGLKLYGGFDGTELTLDDRTGLFQTTVLDGDLGVAGDVTDNAYHVVTFRNKYALALVDGFHVTGGNAVGASVQRGGGVYCENIVSMSLKNCLVDGNAGDEGAGVSGHPAAFVIERCSITGNRALADGGGLFIHTSYLRMTNCDVSGNTAGARGGGIFIRSTHILDASEAVQPIEVVNTRFYSNAAGTRGGAAHLAPGSQSGEIILNPGSGLFANCTFAQNSAGVAGGGVHANNNTSLPSQCWLTNTIVWGNAAPTSPSIHGDILSEFGFIEGGWPGNNSPLDPQFVNMSGGSLHLSMSSPAIHFGSNALLTIDWADLNNNGVFAEPLPIDLDELRRVEGPAVDPGCYEWRMFFPVR